MENKFFLRAICTAVILTTAAIASAEPMVIEITTQDLAPYYSKRYQQSAAATIQPEQSYAAPVIVEEQRAVFPSTVPVNTIPVSNINPIESYLQNDMPLLRPMRGVLPTYGLTAEDFERMEAMKSEQQ